MRLVERINSLLKTTKGNLIYFTIGCVITYPLHSIFLGNPVYHISGAVSGIISRVVDYASTIPLIRLSNTEEFKKSNLGESYYERNILTRKHPTTKQFILRAIPLDVLTLLVTTLYPGGGYTYLTTLPFIVSNHRKIRCNLEEELRKIRVA